LLQAHCSLWWIPVINHLPHFLLGKIIERSSRKKSKKRSQAWLSQFIYCCVMELSVNGVQLSPPQAIIAASFFSLGFLYFAFQFQGLVRMLLSTFVTPGKAVRFSLLFIGITADTSIAQFLWSPRILGVDHWSK
jgi:hypothetical protein